MGGAFKLATAVAVATATLVMAGGASADQASLSGGCAISGVTLPVTIPYSVDAGTPVSGGEQTTATVEVGFPTLPIPVTVDQLTITVPLPAGVGSVNSVTFSGGNLSASYAVSGASLVITLTGPVSSATASVPTVTINETIAAGLGPTAPAWNTFSTIDATTNAGQAVCTPGTVPQAQPLAAPTANPDPFYAPPSGFAATAPGSVLRARPVTIKGVSVPITATQALVRTTNTSGDPVTTVATVMVPTTPWNTQANGPRPLVSYQIAIDAIGALCQPSYLLQNGSESELSLMEPLLKKGYDVVTTDYEGPLYAYAAATMEGQATLDGIRAAEQLPATGLDGPATPVAVWGYSGGAIATGWATELQPTYAPAINLRAAALGGTPADLLATAQNLNGGPVSGLMLMAVIGLAREYPYFTLAFNSAGRTMAADVANACSAPLSYAYKSLASYLTVPSPLTNPLLTAVMAQTKLGAIAPTVPVYIYHAVHDEGIPYSEALNLRAAWCSQNANVTFFGDDDSEHITLQTLGAPAATAFLEARLSGTPTTGNCGQPPPTSTAGVLTPIAELLQGVMGLHP